MNNDPIESWKRRSNGLSAWVPIVGVVLLVILVPFWVWMLCGGVAFGFWLGRRR